MIDTDSLLFAIGLFTALCGLMVVYALIWERPTGGQPQWTGEEEK